MPINDLVTVTKDRPPIITIAGEMGMGKTSIPWPKPIFICTEDGLQSIPQEIRPPSFPQVKTVGDMVKYLSMLIDEQHEYETLVIDTISRLDNLFIEHVINNDKNQPKSINQALGGYGNGPQAVAALHWRINKACKILNEQKNMTIVFLSHAETETIELPDTDPYMRYTLRLGRKSIPPYADDVDLVGMLRQKVFINGVERGKKGELLKAGKAISSDERILSCSANAASYCKNRYGIETDLKVEKGTNPLLGMIPYFKQTGANNNE